MITSVKIDRDFYFFSIRSISADKLLAEMIRTSCSESFLTVRCFGGVLRGYSFGATLVIDLLMVVSVTNLVTGWGPTIIMLEAGKLRPFLIVCHSDDSDGTMEECFFVVLADLLSDFACLWLESKTFG